MDEEKGIIAGLSPRVPVRVLGCLIRDYITIILCPDNGLADGGVHVVFPLVAVPLDLRMPNSEFDIVFSKQARADIKVVRKDQPDTEA